MLGTIMDVKVILPYPPQLQKDHNDPYVLDQDKNILQESLKTKVIMLRTIPDVMVILPLSSTTPGSA